MVSGNGKSAGVAPGPLYTFMTILGELPHEHPLRNQPLRGSYNRRNLLVSHQVTDPEEKIQKLIERRKAGERKWSGWNKMGNWNISKKTYNDLGPVWTDHAEWTFDDPTTKA